MSHAVRISPQTEASILEQAKIKEFQTLSII